MIASNDSVIYMIDTMDEQAVTMYLDNISAHEAEILPPGGPRPSERGGRAGADL